MNNLHQNKSFCNYCNNSVNEDHWYWQKSKKSALGGYWKCKQQNRDNARRWRKRNPERMRLRSHQDFDRKCGLKCDIDLDFYSTSVKMPCYYCGIQPANGLDRKDSNLGHLKSNCVPCCPECNYILLDIPFEAKLELRSGLMSIRDKQLLSNWKTPPQRR